MIKDKEFDKEIKISKKLTPKKNPMKMNKTRLNSIDKILRPRHKDIIKKDINKVHMIVKSLELTSSKMISPQGKRLKFKETMKMKRNNKKTDLVLENQSLITTFLKEKECKDASNGSRN